VVAPGDGDELLGRGYPRLLALLELLAEHPGPITGQEIAATLDIPKSTAYLLAQHLVRRRYLVVHGEGGFVAGPGLYRLGLAIVSRHHVRNLARPLLERLRDETRSDVYLATRMDDEVVFLDRLEGERILNVVAPLTQPRQLHCTAAGKVILAFDDPELLARIERSGEELTAMTSHTITNPAALAKEIRAVRRKGFAISDGEQYEGVLAVGAPVRGADGKLVAVVVSSGYAPTIRQDLRARADAVVATAGAVSDALVA
jgi:IclR family transcriptional regulator, acetate operon repressor